MSLPFNLTSALTSPLGPLLDATLGAPLSCCQEPKPPPRSNNRFPSNRFQPLWFVHDCGTGRCFMQAKETSMPSLLLTIVLPKFWARRAVACSTVCNRQRNRQQPTHVGNSGCLTTHVHAIPLTTLTPRLLLLPGTACCHM